MVNGAGDNVRLASSYVEREVVNCEEIKVWVADNYVERMWFIVKGIV